MVKNLLLPIYSIRYTNSNSIFCVQSIFYKHQKLVNGNWSEYLYQLATTGSKILLYSNTNYSQTLGCPNLGPGYIKMNLNLSYIDNPSEYGILFYTTRALNESAISDFTDWSSSISNNHCNFSKGYSDKIRGTTDGSCQYLFNLF